MQRLRRAGPVPRGALGQRVGIRPDAETGIVHDEGRCRRAQLSRRILLRRKRQRGSL
jgi:hypothetical protein